MNRTEPTGITYSDESRSFVGSVGTSLEPWQKSEELPIDEPKDHYKTVSDLFDNIVEAPGDQDIMALYVDLSDGKKVYLAKFIAVELFRMLSAGEITKEQCDVLYEKGMKILNNYREPRIAKRAIGATMIHGAERRIGWDPRELAVGEYHD